MSPPALVVGLGNMIAGDDAVGLMAAMMLATQLPSSIARVELCDNPNWGLFESLPAESSLYIIDAVQSGAAEISAIHELSPEDSLAGVSLRHCSSHGIGIAEWIATAKALGNMPARLRIFGIEVAEVGLGAPLSEAIETALPDLVTAIARRIRTLEDSDA